jgi:uncharacterized YigZ family protein
VGLRNWNGDDYKSAENPHRYWVVAMHTISTIGHADQTINKSRFIAIVARCNSERDAALFLREFAAQHTHASHLAFAYQIKTEGGIIQRMSDAGEPSGTAGRPILQPIEGMKLMNVCVGVIRYYGGINLGTGGLARAYGSTARMALEDAQIVDFIEMQEITMQVSYSQLDSLLHEINKLGGRVLDKQFGENVLVKLLLPINAKQALIERFGAAIK